MNNCYYNYGYGCNHPKSDSCCPHQHIGPTKNNLEAVSLEEVAYDPNTAISFERTPVQNGTAILHNMPESVIHLNKCGVYLVLFTTNVKLPCYPHTTAAAGAERLNGQNNVGGPPSMCVDASVNIWVNSYPLEYTTVSQTIKFGEVANLSTQAIIQVPKCGCTDITIRNATTGSKYKEISLIFENPNISVIKIA